MLRDRWYITVLILVFLALSVTVLLVRWHTMLGRVPLTSFEPVTASADVPDTGVDRKHAAGRPPAEKPPAATADTSHTLNINTASAADFEVLPGIGPVLAARIIAYRNDHGPFARIDDLLGVDGIGEGKLYSIRALVDAGPDR